jgi:hypothetical protein
MVALSVPGPLLYEKPPPTVDESIVALLLPAAHGSRKLLASFSQFRKDRIDLFHLIKDHFPVRDFIGAHQ